VLFGRRWHRKVRPGPAWVRLCRDYVPTSDSLPRFQPDSFGVGFRTVVVRRRCAFSMTARRHLSQVNWHKIIDDFRSAYQLRDAWEIVLIELIANSIDAGATEVDLLVAGQVPKVLRVIDNGKGMTHSEFGQYHNLGSLTKTRGTGIGWAGVGAKLYLDRSASIYTETR